MKRKGTNEIRKDIRKQLGYLRRDICYINNILARLADTHESWVASIVFIMNTLIVMEDIFWQFFKECFFYKYMEINLTENLCYSHKIVKSA